MDNKSLNAIWHSMQINDFNTTKTNLMIDISVYICIKDYVLLYTENFVLHLKVRIGVTRQQNNACCICVLHYAQFVEYYYKNICWVKDNLPEMIKEQHKWPFGE